MNKNNKILNSQPIESIIKEASKQPLLTIEQTNELAYRIKQGDEDAIKRLIICNKRFVISIAKLYLDRGLTFEELIETGNKGLELAAMRFDPNRGFKFIAFAVWYIRANILARLCIKDKDKGPSDFTDKEKKELICKLPNEREKEILSRWFGISKTSESHEEIGQNLNLTTERVRQIKDKAILKMKNHSVIQ